MSRISGKESRRQPADPGLPVNVCLCVRIVTAAKINMSADSVTKTPFTRYNGLSNQFDNRLYRVNKHSTGCQTGLTTGLTTGCIHDIAVCQTGFTTTLTARFHNRFENRLHCVYKHFTRLSSQFDNWFDNRLCCVNGA